MLTPSEAHSHSVRSFMHTARALTVSIPFGYSPAECAAWRAAAITRTSGIVHNVPASGVSSLRITTSSRGALRRRVSRVLRRSRAAYAAYTRQGARNA